MRGNFPPAARTIVCLFAASAGLIWAQDPRPAFEVASIKLDNSGSGHSGTDGSPGQIMFTNLTMERLIERAYGVKPSQVQGPDWIENTRFDIVAKYPEGTKSADHPVMLRTLLEDRFKLAVHRETAEKPGYALMAIKSGFKLKPVEKDGSDTNHQGGRIQTLSAKGTSMAKLADLLSRYLGEVVIDKTGISGAYNFDLRWTSDDEKPNEPGIEPAPTLFIALQETLGLRLQGQKVPVEMIVVDHLERTPTEN